VRFPGVLRKVASPPGDAILYKTGNKIEVKVDVPSARYISNG